MTERQRAACARMMILCSCRRPCVCGGSWTRCSLRPERPPNRKFQNSLLSKGIVRNSNGECPEFWGMFVAQLNWTNSVTMAMNSGGSQSLAAWKSRPCGKESPGGRGPEKQVRETKQLPHVQADGDVEFGDLNNTKSLGFTLSRCGSRSTHPPTGPSALGR